MRNSRALKAVTEPVLCVLYLRLSDLRDDDLDADGAGKTFAAREQDLRDEADDLNWTVVDVIVENDVTSRDGKHRPASAFKRRMVDLPDGTRGLRTIRPGFRKILQHFQNGTATGLLAEDGDRITRDGRDGEDLLDLVEMKRLNVRTLTGVCNLTNGGTDAEIGSFRDAVNAANKEARKMRARAKRGRRRKAKAGEFGGGPRPFGFDADGLTKRWDECLVVAIASKRVVDTDGRKRPGEKLDSLRLLAAELRDAGVPTVKGGKWSAETLRDILLRPRNAGIMVHDRAEIGTAPWSPIVPVETFRAVQRILTDPSRRNGPGAAPKWFGSGIYRCGKCNDGTTMQVTLAGRAPRYTCKATNHLARNLAHTDAYVEALIVERLSRPDAAALFAPAAPSIDVAALRAEAQAIRVNLNGLATDLALNRLTREQVFTATEAGRARLDEIDGLVTATVGDSPAAQVIRAPDVGAAFAVLPLGVRRAILRELCTVTILPATKRGSGFDPRSVLVLPVRPTQLDEPPAHAEAA
ncbi:recombinase family protein [Amycolatopsis sp. CA-128772]|uniref:recombinase family protein n=1 Tax=Amycolatopsis sp. CA-128772 TaxID=2073159 RepID=UPI0011B04754|nr:recombinase family protein [Amycolatopsis sp. CA-128772]